MQASTTRLSFCGQLEVTLFIRNRSSAICLTHVKRPSTCTVPKCMVTYHLHGRRVSVEGAARMSHDPSTSVAELTEQLKNGSQDALALLFARYRHRLLKIVRFRMDPRLSSRISEFDVLQDSYISAVDRISHFSQAAPSLSAFIWLRLLISQQLTELYRRHLGAEMRDMRLEVRIDASSKSSHTSQSMARFLLPSKHKTPSQIVAQFEELDKIEANLAELSEFDQEMIALRHFEELSNSEVAEVLQIEPATARKRYVRAMRRLKDRVTMTDQDELAND